MNPLNETVVSKEMMEQLRKAGLDDGYEPVPNALQKKAENLLRGRALANMDAEMRRRVRNLRKQKRRAGVPGY